MWISRKRYESLMDGAAEARLRAARLEEAVAHLKERVAELAVLFREERARAEAAIDELIKFRTDFLAQPISTEAREKVDVDADIFSEEDPLAVQRMEERIRAGVTPAELFETE